MGKIILLKDYKGKFGSKHFDNPYRSGMDKELLSKYFKEYEFETSFVYFYDVDVNDNIFLDSYVLYTSSEDIGYHYKSYIEDIIFALEINGVKVIPKYEYLRANNNKVFMELLRKLYLKECKLNSLFFGSLKDLLFKIDEIVFPVVFKAAEGASGSSVFLVRNKKELIQRVKKIKTYSYIKEDIRDYLRAIKHKGYKKESVYRNKFIIQHFIPNLNNDWKVYVFGEKFYIFKRPILKGRGIKASGGGYDNYFYGKEANPPDGIFDFCNKIFNYLDIPHISLDIAFDGKNFYLIEFQGLYFGTAGIPYSKGYFVKKNNEWVFIKNELTIEKVYVDSIVSYIKKA